MHWYPQSELGWNCALVCGCDLRRGVDITYVSSTEAALATLSFGFWTLQESFYNKPS